MDIDTHDDLETKAGIPPEAVVTHGEMMRAFEAFKEANDERLDKRDADVVLEEKLSRINATIDAQGRRLDEITLKSARGRSSVLSAPRSAASLRSSTRPPSRLTCARAKRAGCARSRPRP